MSLSDNSQTLFQEFKTNSSIRISNRSRVAVTGNRCVLRKELNANSRAEWVVFV